MDLGACQLVFGNRDRRLACADQGDGAFLVADQGLGRFELSHGLGQADLGVAFQGLGVIDLLGGDIALRLHRQQALERLRGELQIDCGTGHLLFGDGQIGLFGPYVSCLIVARRRGDLEVRPDLFKRQPVRCVVEFDQQLALVDKGVLAGVHRLDPAGYGRCDLSDVGPQGDIVRKRVRFGNPMTPIGEECGAGDDSNADHASGEDHGPAFDKLHRSASEEKKGEQEGQSERHRHIGRHAPTKDVVQPDNDEDGP